MDFNNFLVFSTISTLSFMGIITGYILTVIAPEEIKPGNHIFKSFARICYAMLLVVFVHSFNMNLIIEIFFLLVIILMMCFVPLNDILILITSGIILAYSTISKQMLFLTAILNFLTGAALVGIFSLKYIKKDELTIKKTKFLTYVVIRYGLYLITTPLTYLILTAFKFLY